MLADEVRLRQVLVNLAGNALKFTERGGIEIRVAAVSAIGRHVELRFSVIDTGIGIPENKLTSIFSPFTQADASIARKHGGTGLGLAISNRLAALMNGRLWAESEEGAGSRFHFTGQFEVVEANPTAAPWPAEKLRGLRALIVDEQDTNRKSLERSLARWGMVCTATNSPIEALRKINEAAVQGEPFALLVTAYQVREMDGLELVRRIGEGGFADRLPVVMLSSSLVPGDAGSARALYVTSYLTKPVGRSELLDAILKSLGPTEPTPTPGGLVSAGEAHSPRPPRILLAEDNRVNQVVATALLKNEGYQVTVANNGQEALQMLASDEPEYDAILMDVQMPVMDGFETTQTIRRREKVSGKHIPIIALTAHAMKGDRDRCVAMGMDGYVSKPIRIEELHRELDAALGLRPPEYVL